MNFEKSAKLMLLATLAVAAAALTGCKSYNEQNRGTPLWKTGNVPGAVAEFGRMAKKKGTGKDAIIWHLEHGTSLRAAGQFSQSNQAFEAANQRIEQFDAKARVSVSSETAALLSNQANLPYRGRDYDKIMLSIYRAMNYLQLHQFDKARPEIIRAYQRQQDAASNNSKRIAREQEEIEEAARSPKNEQAAKSVDRARKDPALQGKLDDAYSPLDSLRPYADYVNPFAVYLDGLYFRLFSTGGSDLERARKSIERALTFASDNPYLHQEMEEINQLLQGNPPAATTYVIFETGCAPWRAQERIDLPLFFIGQGNVPYVGASFPVLQIDPHFTPHLNVEADGTRLTSAIVASMDSIVASSFKDELPTIISKTLLSTTIKATAAYGVNKAAGNQDALLGLFSQIITASTQLAMNLADTRTWTTLPKEFQICRFPTPKDGRVVLSNPRGTEHAELTVEAGSVNIIFVKSIDPNSAFTINLVQLH